MSHISIGRTIGIGLMLSIIFSFSLVGTVYACDITITPSQVSGTIGETIDINVEIYFTHRNCTVPIEDTQIKLESLSLINQTAWEASDSRTYTSLLTVKIIDEGVIRLTVTRECIKGGDSASVVISTNDSSESGVNYFPTEPEIVTPSSSSQENTSNISWGEAFIKAISQPYIIAYLSLTGIAYIAFKRQVRKWRFVSLAFSMIYLGFFLGLCPCTLGALQNTLLHITEAKTYMIHFVLLGIPVVSTLFWGRLFCGWVCPMGAVQQLLYRKDMNIKIPDKIHKVLKNLPYVILAGLIVAVFYTNKAVFAEVDPFKSLYNLEISVIPTTLLILTLATSLFIFAPWCRYACPMGAFLSFIARFSLFKLRFTETCKNCAACAKVYCNYQAISVGKDVPMIAESECSRCGECLARCPKESLVHEKFPVLIEKPKSESLEPVI
jgi:hypothetical protein